MPRSPERVVGLRGTAAFPGLVNLHVLRSRAARRNVRTLYERRAVTLHVGVIGFGAIGQQVVQGIAEGRAGDAEVCAALVRQPHARALFTDFYAFLGTRPDVVLGSRGVR